MNHFYNQGFGDDGAEPDFRKPLRHAARLIASLALAVSATTASLAARDEPTVRLAIDERGMRAAGINTGSAEPDAAGHDLVFPGTVVVPPQQSTVVASPAAGMLESIIVTQDEAVRADQVIAKLRSPQVVEAQHLYLAALTDEKLAADKLRRADVLYNSKAMSEVQLVHARGELAHAQARVDERLQILQLMGVSKDDIERLKTSRRISNSIDIHAPVDGTIIARNVSQGTRVEAAAALFTIASLNPLWVNVQVPTARMSAISEGSLVTLPAQGARGRVIRIGRTVDPATQSIGVVAEIDTNGGSVRPGLAVNVNVRIDDATEGRWSVPIASVVRLRGRSWIFVQSADGFDARPVEVISESGQRASVRAEIKSSERIAVQGVLALAAELAENDEH